MKKIEEKFYCYCYKIFILALRMILLQYQNIAQFDDYLSTNNFVQVDFFARTPKLDKGFRWPKKVN